LKIAAAASFAATVNAWKLMERYIMLTRIIFQEMGAVIAAWNV
jgi:hypothetical protein